MKAISELPIEFCNVPPAVLLVNDPIVPEPPSCYIGLEHGTMAPVDVPEEEEFQWLRNAKELASKATLEKGDFISWAAFHTSSTNNSVCSCSDIASSYVLRERTFHRDDSTRFEYDQSCSKSCQPRPNTQVTRTRRVHQVTATCLFILQSKAYSDYLETLENGEEPLQFTDWVNKMSKERPQFLYWNRFLFLELCVL